MTFGIIDLCVLNVTFKTKSISDDSSKFSCARESGSTRPLMLAQKYERKAGQFN
jgi:hypothetical protein